MIFNSMPHAFKVFVAHRPFYCINKFLNDRCNGFHMITKVEEKFADFGFHMVLTGHKHLYQSF